MNYVELKAAIKLDSRRSDMDSEIPRFIREAEGLIRRELRAYPLSYTLTETDRVLDGRYTLPSGFAEMRQIYSADNVPLDPVSLSAIGPQTASNPVRQYASLGRSIIIIGTPATDDQMKMEYLGTPTPLASDTDTNDLLTDHESIYIDGALFYLRKSLQDLELANEHLSDFSAAIQKLNSQFGRRIGNANTSGGYNFNSRSSY